MALMTIVVSHNQNILYIFLESYAKVKCAVVAIFIQDNIMALYETRHESPLFLVLS
jgi:hypothetical protein